MAPALVLLHGFTHTGQSWSPVRAALGERYRSLAPDLRGHGEAGSVRPVTLEAVIGDLDQALREPFVLGGYSMGGRIALHAALAIPGRIERLILIGASPGISDLDERRTRAKADGKLAGEIERSGIEAFVDRWAATPVLGGQPEGVEIAARNDRLRNTPGGLARALRGLGTGTLPSLWDRLGEVGMPVVLIVGERDSRFRAVAEEMLVRLPRGELHVVPRAGHAVHLEQPAAVAALI